MYKLEIILSLEIRDEFVEQYGLPVAISRVLNNNPKLPEEEAATKLFTETLPQQMTAELKARVVPPLQTAFHFVQPDLVESISPLFDASVQCDVTFNKIEEN